MSTTEIGSEVLLWFKKKKWSTGDKRDRAYFMDSVHPVNYDTYS